MTLCVTITVSSRFTVSIILVVITTVKERRVVAILLHHSNATSVDILISIRHWMERATKVLIICRFHVRPHGEGEKTVGSQAVTCRHCCL